MAVDSSAVYLSVFTFTGSSVAEKASCRAQQANRHISSVNTGPTVTKTYLKQQATENKPAYLITD